MLTNRSLQACVDRIFSVYGN